MEEEECSVDTQAYRAMVGFYRDPPADMLSVRAFNTLLRLYGRKARHPTTHELLAELYPHIVLPMDDDAAFEELRQGVIFSNHPLSEQRVGAWSAEDSSDSHHTEDTCVVRTSAKAKVGPKPDHQKKKKRGSHAKDPHHGKLRGFLSRG